MAPAGIPTWGPPLPLPLLLPPLLLLLQPLLLLRRQRRLRVEAEGFSLLTQNSFDFNHAVTRTDLI